METKSISNRIGNLQLENLFITAFEGGSSYWCSIDSDQLFRLKQQYYSRERSAPAEYVWDAILNGETVEFANIDDETETWNMSLEIISQGCQKMYEEQKEYYGYIMLNEIDADVADVWFQICTLGEIVYA